MAARAAGDPFAPLTDARKKSSGLRVLPARQVVKDVPWQIMASDLELPEVLALRLGSTVARRREFMPAAMITPSASMRRAAGISTIKRSLDDRVIALQVLVTVVHRRP